MNKWNKNFHKYVTIPQYLEQKVPETLQHIFIYL